MKAHYNASHMLVDAIEQERPMATSKALEFPHSTCVECGSHIPAGSMQRCSLTSGGFCSWRVPAAVRVFIETGMVREAIVKERKVNVVNLIVGGAFLVVIVALVLEVAHVL